MNDYAFLLAQQSEYLDVDECIAEGIHLTSCDDDGYCNHCGEQTPTEPDPDEVYDRAREEAVWGP